MVEYWYIPCNIKFCNVIQILDKCGEIIWRRGASIKKDDIAYIYIGAPISEIVYKCIVVDAEVSKEVLENNLYAKRRDDSPRQKYMRLKMIKKYKEGALSLKELKENGLSQVQRQARNSRQLQAFIDTKE